MFTEEHLQAGKLGDCYVHNGDVFYSFDVSDYLKMLVVRDMKSELAASSFVDSHVKATLWIFSRSYAINCGLMKKAFLLLDQQDVNYQR